MFRALLIIFFIGANLPPCFAEENRIVAINFEGLTKTNPDFLSQYITTRVGDIYDSVAIEKDVQLLRNLNLFFAVSSNYTTTVDHEYAITFTIEEAIYLYPIASVSGFQDQLKIQIGANQINFLGKAQSIGAQYQYYDRHSFVFFYNAPIHTNRKTGHELAIAKYSTIEPLYFKDTTARFNFDNYSLSVGGFYWLTRKITVGLGGMYMFEKYEQLDLADVGLPATTFNFNKYQIRSTLHYNALNQTHEFVNGFKAFLHAETIQTQGVPQASFFKFNSTLSYFKRTGKNGNIGVHQQFGIATNNFSPFAPFVLDGFLNVRGVGNRVARGTGIITLNGEYRHTVIRKKRIIGQLVGFIDYGIVRLAGAKEFATSTNDLNLFTGLGIRIHPQFIYKMIFRIDYSLNPFSPNKHGLTFGVGQFF